MWLPLLQIWSLEAIASLVSRVDGESGRPPTMDLVGAVKKIRQVDFEVRPRFQSQFHCESFSKSLNFSVNWE